MEINWTGLAHRTDGNLLLDDAFGLALSPGELDNDDNDDDDDDGGEEAEVNGDPEVTFAFEQQTTKIETSF